MPRVETEGDQISFLVEDDATAWGAGDTHFRAFVSACITLTLGVLGSSILPIPFAISKTGVLVGCITMVVVALANSATSCMLIRAASATGKPTYEALAEWAGGRPWKVFTQISLVALLWGTMCGGLALIHDVGGILVERLAAETGQDPPWWLTGRTSMTFVALFVLFPLCLQRHMRELERAATAGVVLVLALIVLLAAKAVISDFPAIHRGELQLWSLKVDSHLPEAFAVVGYAFYMQPMMMPLLREMPEGQAGVKIMERAVRTTLYGIALTIYFAMGLFGASIYGQDTQGNIMVNALVSGSLPTIVLYGFMLMYLALGMTTTQFALRASLDLMLVGEDAPFTWMRQIAMTMLTVGSSLAVALLVPDQAEKIYAVVGASAVCVVCYIIPVFIQLRLFSRHRGRLCKAVNQGVSLADAEVLLSRPLLEEDGPAPAGPDEAGDASSSVAGGLPVQQLRLLSSWHRGRECVQEVLLPVAILVLGVGFSVAALYVAVLPLLPGIAL